MLLILRGMQKFQPAKIAKKQVPRIVRLIKYLFCRLRAQMSAVVGLDRIVRVE